MKVNIQGRFAAVEAEESLGSHVSVRVGPARPGEPLKVVSVFVRTDDGADVAVSVNGTWWAPGES